MFAIVARTLGCRHSEAEARKLLLSERFDEAEIDDLDTRLTSLLQHLRGAGLGRPLNLDCHHASSQGVFVLVAR